MRNTVSHLTERNAPIFALVEDICIKERKNSHRDAERVTISNVGWINLHSGAFGRLNMIYGI